MSSKERQTPKTTRHWGTMFLGLIVAGIFIIAVFTYQVKSTEWAVVTTLGNITSLDSQGKFIDRGAGLFPKWPYPIQKVERFDKRNRCFGGNIGKLEETLTNDKKNVIIGIFIVYRITDPVQFFKSVITVQNAEEQLNSFMRTSKNAVIGRYRFDQIVNTDSAKVKLSLIEDEIRKEIAASAAKIGIEVGVAGINSIQLPEKIAEKVFNRMITERAGAAAQYRSQGRKEAEIIKANADREKSQVLSDAEAKAKTIRAEGDAKAAEYYSVFRQDPGLAAFLRKIDSLKKIMKTKTTLVLDTDSAPFDLFKLNASELEGKETTKMPKKQPEVRRAPATK